MDEQYPDDDYFSGGGQGYDIERENREHRRMVTRYTVIGVTAAFLVCALIAGMVFFLFRRSGGPKVPDLVGKPYNEAKAAAGAARFGIQIDDTQDSSMPHSDLEVTEQSPKPGSEGKEGETIIVRLKGLDDIEKAVGNGDEKREGAPVPAEEEAQSPAQAGDNAAANTGSGLTVCLDPGHSTGCPASEIDPATGLDVADNGGASGELETNWEIAVRAKAKLEQAGYTVRMTKSRPDMYASLRTRADIGNTCSAVVRIHFDPALHALIYPAEGQYKKNGNAVKYVDPGVASVSARLADAMFPFLRNAGITSRRNDCGGTSSNTGSAFVGSVLSVVPVVLIENNPAVVRGNAAGQEKVADAIVQGLNAYFNR